MAYGPSGEVAAGSFLTVGVLIKLVARVLPADAHCFVKLSGPLFVTVPKSPLEVMSVVPVNEVPLTVP